MRRQFADLGDPIGQLTHDGMILWRQRLESEIAARVTGVGPRRSVAG
jgi:hypothetical protein